MKFTKASLFAWLYFGVIAVVTSWGLALQLRASVPQANGVHLASVVASSFAPIVFAFVGALIVSRQPRNGIGWLLMLPPFAAVLDAVVGNMIRGMSAPPPNPPFSLFLAVWLWGTGWLLLIFPLIFIALLFPNGTPLSPRWRWVVGFGGGMVLFLLILSVLAKEMRPDPNTSGVNWTIPNPIGVLSPDAMNAIVFPWWLIALITFTLLSLLSLILRYRRAAGVEREQIKWLLYAVGLFAAFYVPLLASAGPGSEALAQDLFGIGLSVFILGFPISIGIAILRYRLWDIDVIIRRTVTYALVTALLAIVFFGSVILLQQLFAQFTNTGGSEIITVISTLTIAALFVPLRNRVQNEIDKRYNRKKYDAQKIMEKFSRTVRDETDIDKLANELVNVVQETMQPKSVSLWLKKEKGGKR